MGRVNLIAAVGKRGQMGLNGEMPWGLTQKDDLKWFLRTTKGHVLIAGSRTARTLPSPLGFERDLYVWHRGTDPAHMIETIRREIPGKDIFIVGGARTYKAFLPLVERLLIGRVDYDGPADTWFPFEELALR